MSVIIIESKELGISCWSALRFFEKCHECRSFQAYWRNETEDKMKCPKSLHPQILELLTQKRNHFKQIRMIERKIKLMEDKQ